ncbi:MAG: hypothetical protein F6K24_33090 [Okeania sp. SIO2D1]|nr:hypothetical protein [Okeania sp. SIO2D1]
MNQFYTAFTLFLSLLVEAMPFLLIGVVFSSGLLLFIDEQALIKRLPQNPLLGSIIGSCIGFLFPVCECGNVPVARRLLIQGMPTSVAIGFLLAAPTVNPIVIWSTWVAFREQPEIVWLRVLFSLIVAIVIACVFGLQRDPRPLLPTSLARRVFYPIVNSTSNQPALLQSGSYLLGTPNNPKTFNILTSTAAATAYAQTQGKLRASEPSKFELFLENSLLELRELGGMLIIGP